MNSSSHTPENAERRSRYDELVARSPQGSVFATSWWLDAVVPGSWRMHEVEKGGELLAAWPTAVRRSRFGDVHAGAPLTPFLGPLLPPPAGARQRSRELEAIELLLDRIGPYAHLEARCSPAFDYWTPLHWRGFTQTTNYTWRLEELGDLDAVFRGFRENVRRNVRAGEKDRLIVEEAPLDEFLGLHGQRAVADEGGWTATPREIVERVDSAAAAHDAREILVARDEEGRARAGAYYVHDARFTYYLMAATDAEARGSGALVVWEGIKRAAARGTGFDFEGSMLRPVERFVRGFGGVPAPYSVVRHTPSTGLRLERALKRTALRLRR